MLAFILLFPDALELPEVILDHVPQSWQARVRDVLTGAGEVRALDELHRRGTWVGPTSPKTAEALNQMGPEEVLVFLNTWNPPPGACEPTPEGLGRILQEVIASNPAVYVDRAASFEAVDPTFVRFFFSGLEAALRQSRTFAWPPVLALAPWVVKQPREIPGRKRALMEADPDWKWTRGAIASELLLQVGQFSSGILKKETSANGEDSCKQVEK